MLQRKNQQLSAELAVLRQENQELEKSIAELRDKQTEYTDTLVGVDRLWKQLNNDMAYIGQRIRFLVPHSSNPLDGMPSRSCWRQARALKYCARVSQRLSSR